MPYKKLYLPLVFGALVALAFARLPLMDRTESRVAVVADQLLSSDDPFHLKVPKDGELVPYYAKPPLHYWTVAASIERLGHFDFAVRLPSLVAMMIVLWTLLAFGIRSPSNSQYILASSAIFFFTAGLGLIDATLGLALTLCLLGLHRWCCLGSRRFRDIALMSGGATYACALKGLVGFAIPGLTLIFFCCAIRSVSPLRDLPWKRAVLATMIPLVAYYTVVEYHNPGFLRYFFINENLLRYLVSDYGDRTGSGHSQFFGASLAFAALAALPWSPLLALSLWHAPPKTVVEKFLVAAILAPIALFLFARHHLATYQLPMLVPMALLLGARLKRDVVSAIAWCALALFTLCPLVGAGLISENFSSADIFEDALEQGVRDVHFQYEVPLSAYWYGSSRISYDMDTPSRDYPRKQGYFVLRDKHRSEFVNQFGSLCANSPTKRGKWWIFQCGLPA